jgi:hypothetical protein
MNEGSKMTETSKESTQRLSDTINVLPILSEAKAPVSLTLTIDKSVSKIASWALTLILSLTIMAAVAATITVMLWSRGGERERDVNNKLTVSENHWRNLEVQQNLDHAEIEKLKEELSHARR